MTESRVPLWTFDAVTLDGDGRPRLDVEFLEIFAGRTAVIGASGAGKTSLLNLLVGFETASRGQLTKQISPDSNRLPLFWIPPDGGLWPHATVAGHLRAIMPDGDQRLSVDERLAAFGLTDRATARPGELSAGERSRLAAARGLAAEAGVLVADEPLVHVDPARLESDWNTLVDDTRHHHTSLVFSTHSPEQVLRHADRVVVLAAGKVIAQGDVAALYREPASLAVAKSLGLANWFDAPETSAWGVGDGGSDVCLRPEEVVLVPDDNGPARVLGSKAIGAIRETRLELIETSLHRTLIHLADPTRDVPTDRVSIVARTE